MSSWFGSQVVRDPDLLSIENDRGPTPYLESRSTKVKFENSLKIRF